MIKPPLEIEVKFYLTDILSYEKRVRSIGATLVRPRTREVNYRFDTPEMHLAREHRVLRLRQDNSIIITYKGPTEVKDGVSVRPEIELEVNDFQAASDLFEALGFRLSLKYEKWRTIYQLGDLEITLDEMPFGNFTEIEGGDSSLIQKTASLLALDWKTGITDSYLLLFDHLKSNKNLEIKDLTFEALKNMTVTPVDLGVKPSDLPRFL
jgi:adenylate cyclase, class 2